MYPAYLHQLKNINFSVNIKKKKENTTHMHNIAENRRLNFVVFIMSNTIKTIEAHRHANARIGENPPKRRRSQKILKRYEITISSAVFVQSAPQRFLQKIDTDIIKPQIKQKIIEKK